MITKSKLEEIMDALTIKCWGIIIIDADYRQQVLGRDLFNVPNSLFKGGFSGEQTVLTILLPYGTQDGKKPDDGIYGKVDPSAWSFDYHVEVQSLLGKIEEQMMAVLGRQIEGTKRYVDQSPYNDREIAYYCGLGQVGFHHLLINPVLGSSFFIGYLIFQERIPIEGAAITGINQLPDTVAYGGCISCGKCLSACPTGVCGPDGDMRYCISALSQTKNQIEFDYLTKMSNRVYGCNICQRVCPVGTHKRSHPAVSIKTPNWLALYPLLTMTQKRFKEVYGHMGFSWRGLWVMKRNALVVFGNHGGADELRKLRAQNWIEEDQRLAPYYKWAINQIENRIFKHSDTSL